MNTSIKEPAADRPRTALRLPVLWVCLMLLAAATVYAVVLKLTDGLFSKPGLIVSAGVIAVVFIAAIVLRCGRGRGRLVEGRDATLIVAGLCLVAQAVFLIRGPLAQFFNPRGTWEAPLVAVLTVAMLLLAAAALLNWPWRTRWSTGAACVCFVVVGILLVRDSWPGIDTHMFHQLSAEALAAGINPYTIDFPNIYGEGTEFYSPETLKNDRVQSGFQYPPFSLLLCMPAFWLTGETRYTFAFVWCLAGLCTTTVGRSTICVAAGALMLTSPIAFYVIEHCWTEPIVLAGLAAVVWSAVRRPGWLPVVFGLFLATKQYTLLFLPFLWFLLPRPILSRQTVLFLITCFAVTAVVSLPLALWDWAGYWNSNVTFQVRQPFRFDSFSYLAWWARPGEPLPPSWISFAMVLPAYVIAFALFGRGPAGFSFAVAITCILFFFFARQSFINYHSLTQGSLLLTAAALGARPAGEADGPDSGGGAPR